MSGGEIIIILLVLILIIKPEDLPKLLSIFRKIKMYFDVLQSEVSQCMSEIEQEAIQLTEEEKINIYLARIIDLGYVYEGELNFKEIQQFYYKLLQDKYDSNTSD